MFCFRARVACGLLLSAALVLAFAGCSKEALPQSFPVSGKVVRKDGKPGYAGSVIVFESLVKYGYQGSGEIASDGTFNLNTIAHRSDGTSEYIKGVIEGECKISIIPGGDGQIFVLRQTYKVEPKENSGVVVNADDRK
jgi:hypothetical protein